MALGQIFLGAALAFLWILFFPRRKRLYFLLACSVIAVFWFQPGLPIRGLDFWLPFATLAITVMTWAVTAPAETRLTRANWATGAFVAALVLLLGATRYLPIDPLLTAGRPPPLTWIVLALAAAGLLAFFASRGRNPALAPGLILAALVAVLVVLKNPTLAVWADVGLRRLAGQPITHASIADLQWLGFSYIAFRLMHTIRDRQSGRLPPVDLAEYVTYVIFFPSLVAGPIDRLERFIHDVREPLPPAPDAVRDGGWRMAMGLFKKFVVADGLALIALNATNALQVRGAVWAWALLYAYALRIYFDFSGYTDIAIGLGQLLGVRLPENFNAPYLQPNLTQFWNRWHMTLTQWFRAYVFNPLTRRLRSGARPVPIAATVFVTQGVTMLLIGMWHGVTWNFALWGAWHGLGLFAHNRWSEYARRRHAAPGQSRAMHGLMQALGVLLTFNYVALGWVFFALPSPAQSLGFMLKLVGASR
jgi:D-alanyl-lipoteichoic acid acyltransferase DltB (MBOAT superfamily)